MAGPNYPHSIAAYVTVFGIRRFCNVTAHGTPQKEYRPDQILYVERAEDEYGVASMKEPFCVLQQRDFRAGENAFR